MIYWRGKSDNGDGDLEDYFPGDVIELAESKQEFARKVQKRRLRWPDNVFDEALGSAPCEEELSQKERKKRKEVTKRKEMMAMSSNWPEDGEDGHEREKNQKCARLEHEIISLRKKLAEEKKMNRDLQDNVIKGMEKVLQKACCNHSCTSQQQKRNLGSGITISQAKWQHLMAQPKDSLFVREAAKAICGVQNLYNRSITGTPCRRFRYKEDGPSGVEKQALTPRKLDALR
ncbi:hypothetical protein MTO96_045975, partial [Rhipicephalus appendiculatus]